VVASQLSLCLWPCAQHHRTTPSSHPFASPTIIVHPLANRQVSARYKAFHTFLNIHAGIHDDMSFPALWAPHVDAVLRSWTDLHTYVCSEICDVRNTPVYVQSNGRVSLRGIEPVGAALQMTENGWYLASGSMFPHCTVVGMVCAPTKTVFVLHCVIDAHPCGKELNAMRLKLAAAGHGIVEANATIKEEKEDCSLILLLLLFFPLVSTIAPIGRRTSGGGEIAEN
jgi:hypothetical protein